MSYWDTSALVEIFVQEADSSHFQSFTAGERIVTATLTKHEIRTVFRRRQAEGSLRPGQATRLYSDLLADVSHSDIQLQLETGEVEREFGRVLDQCFSKSPPLFIRTNDAPHLASALVAGESHFNAADQRQREAAELLGFTVLP